MKPKKKLDWHSLRVKSFLYFLLLATSILTFFMFFSITFFEPIYRQSKEKDVKNACNIMIEAYKSNSLSDAIKNTTNPNDVDVLVFSIEEETAVVLFNGTRIDKDGLLFRIQTFLDKYAEGENSEISFSMTENGTQMVLFGKKDEINGEDIYFLTSSKLQPVESTLKTFSTSIIFIFVGATIIAGILSYIFSNSIASPLQKMSKSAKLLSKNNLSTNFDGFGYTESEQLSDTLNFAVAELKKTDELRNELISNVSHELKTPLTMIKSYAELIKDINGDNKVKREENLDVIIEESNRLETLLQDMLDFSKLKSKTMEYTFSEFDICDMLSKIVSRYKTKYANAGYNIELESPEYALVNADYSRLEQVITNLLNNAINYSKENKNILVKLSPSEDRKLKLEIIDHGIGIPKENIPHVFERHFRATNAERVSVGSGIGLSIVKQILDDHHFAFGVKSQINVGSTFFVILPEITKPQNTNTTT